MVLRNRFKDSASIGSSEPEGLQKMDEVLKDMSLQKMRDRLEDLQNSTLENINEQLSTLVGEIMKDVEKCGVSHEFNQLFNKNNKKSTSRHGQLRDKKFIPRNSLLTDLFDIKHISTIHNIFVVIISFLFLHSSIGDYFETGSINFGLSTIQTTFQGFFTIAILWICMFVATQFVYTFFSIWAHIHVQLTPKTTSIYIWDRLWIILYILYQITFMCGFAYLVRLNHYTFGTGMAFFCEQARFMMKCHAFVRSNITRVLNHNDSLKPQTGVQNQILPGFSKYLYFLFAPTLIYQDSYPRTKEIRWGFLLWNVFETIMVLFLLSNLTERFIFNVFDDYGTVHYETKKLLFKIIGLTCPALFIYFSGFYLFLHSWHNAWAEGLRFADRLFYKDWWNATNFSEYFRKWNIIVHDWLYNYVYKDLHENFGRNNKLFPFLSVFIISSIFHEYIVAMSIGFFYPVMFFFFAGIGLFAIFITKQLEKITKNAGNMFMWTGLSFGNGLMIAFYSMEFFARRNCDYQNDSMFASIIPHSWVCNK
ncbi:sterol O-acyltransferase 1-like [Chrysoperla carnea]|uniref:sterol O-acyltransferase 1-like n=1 Tax=Chrysoperla carnea TaxID=189513 RepID=UPI001D060743|nr:sterol O-acyltransferase 1-like [Chrysoperla carnea]